jgi:hypothetical protein
LAHQQLLLRAVSGPPRGAIRMLLKLRRPSGDRSGLAACGETCFPHSDMNEGVSHARASRARSGAACARSSSGPTAPSATPDRETREGQTSRPLATQSHALRPSPQNSRSPAAENSAPQQPGPATVRVKSAHRFGVWIEVMVVEDLIQSRVERVRGTARQVLRRYPHRRLSWMQSSFAHRQRATV